MRTTGNTFECKVERLCGEVADDIDHIATPEGEESLLLVNTSKAVHHSLIPLVYRDSLVSILHRDSYTVCKGCPYSHLNLEQHLHSLQRGNHSLAHCSRHTTGNKVKHEVLTHDE